MVRPVARWFGSSWNAPINHPDYQVPIPFADPCSYCAKYFDERDQGVQIPRVNEEESDFYHRVCWNKLILGPDLAEFIERTRSGQAGQEQQEAGLDGAKQSS
jgi:hypothetical protein